MTTQGPKRRRKPRLSVQIEPADRDALDALLPVLPGRKNVPEAIIIRAMVREGMRAIAENPDLVLTSDPPSREELLTFVENAKASVVALRVDRANMRSEAEREMEEDGEMGTTTFGEGMKKQAPPSTDNPAPHHAHPVVSTKKKAKGPKAEDEPLLGPPSDRQLQKNLNDAQNATSRGKLRSDPKK